MHRGALTIKDLDAALGATAGLLLDGKHTGPATEKQAQVDIGRHHQTHLPTGHHRNVAVVALALVHAVLIARQRHDVTQLAQGRQQGRPLRPQTQRIGLQAAGSQLGLTDCQLLGGIASAQARLLAAQHLPG